MPPEPAGLVTLPPIQQRVSVRDRLRTCYEDYAQQHGHPPATILVIEDDFAEYRQALVMPLMPHADPDRRPPIFEGYLWFKYAKVERCQ